MLTHGPLLGAVTDRSIKIWVRGNQPGRVFARFWPSDRPQEARCTASVAVDAANDLTAVMLADGLTPATTYRYRIGEGDGQPCEASASAEAELRTLGKDGAPSRVRFAVGADVRGSDIPGFEDIRKARPDFVLMIGDNVYADDDGFVAGKPEATYARMQRLYHRVWGGAQFRKLFSSTPVFMTWDDHEIMENYFRGKDDERYGVSRALFERYQASHNPDPLAPGELYFSFRAGQVGFFVLDTRSHRSSNKAPNDAKKTMLGAEQLRAFQRWLAEDDSRVHVIVSSVLVASFGTTGEDPWKGYAVERKAWLDTIAAHGTANTIIVSGDQHWSGIIHTTHGEPPYSLLELQTTPLGSGTRKAPEGREAIQALDNTHRVFGVFDVDTRAEPPELAFTLCAVGKPCEPHAEPPPRQIRAAAASVPYTLRFRGSDRGFVAVTAPVAGP